MPGELALLRQVVGSVAAGVVVVDRDLVVRLWNGWMALHSGRPAAEVVGRSLGDVFPEHGFAGLARKVRQVLLLGNHAFFEAREGAALFPLRADGGAPGHMPQRCILVPLRGDNGDRELVCLSVHDQTVEVQSAAALRRANEQLVDLARIDALTRLLTRRYALERLDEEAARARRTGAPLSVVLCDVDHFKAVNDTHGHLGGDEVLRAVGRALRSAVRTTDLVGRYGGEEFVMVLPACAVADAAATAERARAAVAGTPATFDGRTIAVTMSFGVAGVTGAPFKALADADAALYEAKRAGRDRVMVSAPAA